MRRIRADKTEINNEIEAAVFDDHPETALALLNNITFYYRSEFYKFLGEVISTLFKKFLSLKNVFEPFPNVIDPDKPDGLGDAKKLLATLPSVFPPDAGGGNSL